jgi:uncharacterized protein YbjT (DUF2867 family)
MKVFLAGAGGFIGRALTKALAARGHAVVCGVRDPDARGLAGCCVRLERIDFDTHVEPAAWLSRLDGAEVVVNAVGIIAERPHSSFDAVHTQAPIALFAAALRAGVRRIVQVSALGADAEARSRFHLSKKAADDVLATLPIDWVVVCPGLVYGPGGESARLFTTLASLPWIPIPGRGGYEVQPIHIDDLVEAIVALVESPSSQRRRIPLVGPRALGFGAFLSELRSGLGLGRARFVHIPAAVVAGWLRVPRWLRGGSLDQETLAMLYRGNTADPTPTHALLGRQPRPVSEFIPAQAAWSERASAQLRWLLPILRASIALVWIFTGIVSLGLYPPEQSYELLARAGVPAGMAPAALYGAAALDLLLGFLSLSARRRPSLWLIQMAVIVGYTIIVTVKLPEFWLHPYGPMLKNLPMLAAIWAVYELERRPWNT